MSDLAEVARALVAPGKGILAADESTATIKRRFDAIGVENTEDNRRAYRETLFRTPRIAEYISGVILYDETIRQKAVDGTPLTRASTPASRSISARSHSRSLPARSSPKGSTVCASDSLNTRDSARSSASGAR